MSAIWSLESQYARWARVELAVMEARSALGEISGLLVEEVARAPLPSNESVAVEELSTRHDLVAFLNAWSKPMSKMARAWLHRDLTSSDIVDTAQSMAIVQAGTLISNAANSLLGVMRKHALRHRRTVRLGRTHGRAAQTDVWGHRVADLALMIARSRTQFLQATEMVGVAMISGPVGTGISIDPRIESFVAGHLGLKPVIVSSQVVSRDRMAHWVNCVGLLSTCCDAIALEIRHGQRQEVSELFEPTRAEQVGSSAMPHKTNPILCEKVVGLARVVRNIAPAVSEGIALWHERDISHSSVERLTLPLVTTITEHQLIVMEQVFAGLFVDVQRMRKNLELAGAHVFSATLLSEFVRQGIDRPIAARLLGNAGEAEYERTVRQRAAELGVSLPSQDFSVLAIEAVLKSPMLDNAFRHLEELET